MKQNSPEWHEARAGKITASNLHKIMGARGIGKTGETYIYELIANELGAVNDSIDAFALRYGHEMEPIAVEYFSKAMNLEVKSEGFISASFDKKIGFSPDGIIDGKIGLEIKCPLSVENHVKYMTIQSASDLKKIKPEYYWQVMFSLYCSGFESWYFASFNPKFEGKNRMCVIRIEPIEDDFKLIQSRVEEAKELINTKRNLLNI